MQTGLEVEWFDGGLGWVYFYRGQAHENLLEMKEALDDYNESLEAWNYVPDVTAGTIHDHTQVQRQVRTVHFQRGDLLCGTAAQSRSLSHQLPHRCCSVSLRFAALVSTWWLANAVSCSCVLIHAQLASAAASRLARCARNSVQRLILMQPSPTTATSLTRR